MRTPSALLSLVLPLALIAPMSFASAPGSAHAAESKSKDKDKDKDKDKKPPDYDFGAKVKIELRMEDGTIVKHRGEIRSFGNEWLFEFEGADHKHALVLNVEGEEGKKNFEVTFSYARDGSTVIAPYTDTYTARKRQALWTEDGSLALAMTFYPTKFERRDTSRDSDSKIIPDDSDDPLGGNLFD